MVNCCPHCSADLSPVGAKGACWHCGGKLPESLAVPVLPPSRSIANTARAREWRVFATAGTLLIVALLTLTKGFMAIILFPMFIVLFPLTIRSQVKVDRVLKKDPSQSTALSLAYLQLLGLFVFCVSLPAAGDGDPILFLAYQTPLWSATLFSWGLCLAGAYVYVRATRRISNLN